MKIVVNPSYGMFKLPEEYAEKHNANSVYDYAYTVRFSAELIKYVEEHPKCGLRVIEIPEGSTDYMVQEYDGAETVYYVFGGKIYSAS